MKPPVDLGCRRTGGTGSKIFEIDECVRSVLLPFLLHERLENLPYADHRVAPRPNYERLADDAMCDQTGKVIVEAGYSP